MKHKIPRIAINANQVVNKMKRWSTKPNDVVDMMNTSGFGWDDTRKCVTCDSSQVLSEYWRYLRWTLQNVFISYQYFYSFGKLLFLFLFSLQKHPKVGNHVNKEFKEFEKLQSIFGKDRANGCGV